MVSSSRTITLVRFRRGEKSWEFWFGLVYEIRFGLFFGVHILIIFLLFQYIHGRKLSFKPQISLHIPLLH
jgi:hypothetical protein